MATRSEHVYNAKVTIRSRLYLIRTISQRLSLKKERYTMFRNTVFGPWLDLRTEENDNLVLNFLLQHQRLVDKPSSETPLYFDIGGHTLELGRKEFCLITGFRFGEIGLGHLSGQVSSFLQRVFPRHVQLKGFDLLDLIKSDARFNEISDEDYVRACLLLALDYVFMGQELRHVMAGEILKLVDDFYTWNAFPWGEHMWEEFHDRVYNLVVGKKEKHLAGLAQKGKAFNATYSIYGFAFALKIFVLESFPNSIIWWNKDDNKIPRGVAWGDAIPFKKAYYDRLFHDCIPQPLVPTPSESQALWWRSSVEYFESVSKEGSSTRNEIPRNKIKTRLTRKTVSKEVRRVVHVSTQVRTTVTHEIDDDQDEFLKDLSRLSKAELIQKVLTFERDFGSRLSAVEKKLERPSEAVGDGVVDCQDVVNNCVNDSMEVDKGVSDGLSGLKQKLVSPSEAVGAGVVAGHDVVNNCVNNSMEEDNGVTYGVSGLQQKLESPSEAVGDGVSYGVSGLNESEPADTVLDSKTCGTAVNVFDDDSKINVDECENSPVYKSVDVVHEVEVGGSQSICENDVKNNLSDVPNVISPSKTSDIEVEEGDNGFNNGLNKLAIVAIASKDTDIDVEDTEIALNNVANDTNVGEVAVNTAVHDSKPCVTESREQVHDESMNTPSDGVLDQSMNNADEPLPEYLNLIDFSTPPCQDMSCLDKTKKTMTRSQVKRVEQFRDLVTPMRVPFGREKKKSSYLCSPYVNPPATTPRRSQRFKKQKIYKKQLLELIGPDAATIPLQPWTEDLTRPEGSPPTRVNIPKEINALLRTKEPLAFTLPWYSGVLYKDFWAALMGKDRNRRGWLSDVHIDIWVLYLMHFRPAEVDWVMVSPYFSTMIIDKKMPTYYASGVTYGVPWFAHGVEKVYFPINEPDLHWTLGELEICSGVITIYDSLHGADEDGKLWWDNAKEQFVSQLPKFLDKAQVFEKKNIDPKNYRISFHYSENVPIQGGYYGDCGIWVCIFLYRLSHNLSLDVTDPVQAALAYREHMTDLFWRYKTHVPADEM